MGKLLSILMALSIVGGAFAARAADMATRQVTEALVKASRNDPADFSGLDLSYLDLSTLDFKGANLSDADLYGTDFTSANLSNANLSHTRLDRAVLIRADLSDARLDGASILRPTAFADMRFNLADAPSSKGASMVGVRIQAKLDGPDFSHADLSNADFSPYEDRAGEGTITTVPRNELSNAKFNAANLTKANFSRAVVKFAEFRDANLTGVSLRYADLTQSDFAGADFTGADLAGADFAGANLKGAKGLESAIGLEAALNLATAKR